MSPLLMGSPKLSPKLSIYILSSLLDISTRMMCGIFIYNMSPSQDLNVCSISELSISWFTFHSQTQIPASFTSKVSPDSVSFFPSSCPKGGSRPYFHLLLPGLYPSSLPSPYFLKNHIIQVPYSLTAELPSASRTESSPQPGSRGPSLYAICPAASPVSMCLFLPSHSTTPSLNTTLCLRPPMSLASKTLPRPQCSPPGKFLLILQDLLNVTTSV